MTYLLFPRNLTLSAPLQVSTGRQLCRTNRRRRGSRDVRNENLCLVFCLSLSTKVRRAYRVFAHRSCCSKQYEDHQLEVRKVECTLCIRSITLCTGTACSSSFPANASLDLHFISRSAWTTMALGRARWTLTFATT